jgi:DNA-binding NarL/FixJ family response regulator
MRANNEKLDYIACKLKRSQSSVFSKLYRMDTYKKKYKTWTMKEFNKALELLKQGYTYRQIGEKLGRNRNSIQSRFQEYRKLLKQEVS